ncbi:MAG: hypothetical protein DIAAKJNI_00228 [Candidatus Argoarchaeum ethanivorans]|uniref:Uncharacterized protein n=1 Tax=Candidatus Argoarchaeum ethanivorans TaxID=2608793 RepID=A0A811TBG7_9EURY|nr:MAG: hypothetical protein DIAAKJNI_00228 [Candidatus Argoarchaeum ethanivorans]
MLLINWLANFKKVDLKLKNKRMAIRVFDTGKISLRD